MSNTQAATEDLVSRWDRLLDEIGKAQAELKELKATAKEEGWNLKALAQCVKERRKGAKFQCAQLTLELELTSYREAAGLPVTLEDAQKRAASEARATPSLEDALSSPGLEGVSMSVDGETFHELGPARRGKGRARH